MHQSFSCPNCNANIRYDAQMDSITVTCEYCDSTVIVPESLRRRGAGSGRDAEEMFSEVVRLVKNGRKIEAIKQFREQTGMGLKASKDVVDAIERGEDVWLGGTTLHVANIQTDSVLISTPVAQSSSRGCLAATIGIMVVLFGLIGLGAFLFADGLGEDSTIAATIEAVINGATGETDSPQSGGVEIEIPVVVVTAVFMEETGATSEIAELVHEFGGEEGVGPGFFNDTRRLAVDGEGQIYVGDYSEGRIQVFDLDGTFLAQWNAGEDLYMVGMTADRQGQVYVADFPELVKYDGLSGERLGVMPANGRFDSLTVGPDGKLLAVSPDQLIRFDLNGNVELSIEDPFADLDNSWLVGRDVAVDGAGNMYFIGQEAVYKFDSNGRFVDQFGSDGDAPDQFQTAPTAIAVDGKGRIFVNDFKGIMVFDANGRYLETIPFRGVTFDMWVTTENELVVMDRNGNRILRYALK